MGVLGGQAAIKRMKEQEILLIYTYKIFTYIGIKFIYKRSKIPSVLRRLTDRRQLKVLDCLRGFL